MALKTHSPLRSSNPSLVGAGAVKRTAKTSPFFSVGSPEYRKYKRSLLPAISQRAIEKAEAESRERKAAASRQRERNAESKTYHIKKAAKPNAEGLVYYWQPNVNGKFGTRQFVSEAIAKAVASEVDRVALWGA